MKNLVLIASALLASDRAPKTLAKMRKEEGAKLPRLFLACGTEDSLITANREYRDFLKKQDADVCWEEGPGVHNWTFWNEYIDRGLGHFLG